MSSPSAAATDSIEYWEKLLGKALPLHWTKPTPGAKNELAQCEKVARALGTPLLPWQRLVCRVATEWEWQEHPQTHKPVKVYRYPKVVLTVPRQCGKSTLVKVILITRALAQKGRRAFFTAQTGVAARDHYAGMTAAIRGSVFGKTVKIRESADRPAITFQNGSAVSPFTPKPESLHGKTFDDLVLDEIFAFSQELGDGILGGALLAMQTRLGALRS